MTTVIDERDIQQKEYNDTAKALKVVFIGKTSGGSYIELQVDNSGVVQIH